MIAAIANYLAKLESRSLRFQAANVYPEHTWLNHSLITVILGGGIGGALGWLFVTASFGFKVGLYVALLCYFYRECAQWIDRPGKPERWWWDATLDVLFPVWICSPVLLGELAFYVLTFCVALLHFALRPIE